MGGALFQPYPVDFNDFEARRWLEPLARKPCWTPQTDMRKYTHPDEWAAEQGEDESPDASS